MGEADKLLMANPPSLLLARGSGGGLEGRLFRKVFAGTGIYPVRVHRLKTCATNIFHALWVGRRPIRNWLEKFYLEKFL
jgi:hypothetical protein